MPDIDWSDVFGPAPQRQSSTPNVKDLDAASKEFRSITDRALKLRNRLTRSHAVGFEDNALDAPLLKEVEEAQIVNQNVDAVLKAVDKILQEKREKRIAEESIVRWPWPDTKMASMRARPSAKSKVYPSQGTDLEGKAEQKNLPDGKRSKSLIKPKSVKASSSAKKGFPHAPSRLSHIRSEPDQELEGMAQPRAPSYIKSQSSSLYSRSTNDTASQHSVRRAIDASTSSAGTDSASDNPMIAWPWPSTIVQAATGRSSTASSSGQRQVVSSPPPNRAHGRR
ncbi:hypothetical protein CKM354_000604700 [Cercospora kikuchii]|uniref:Uncharacterized protein n=1 Tax=Cercospora kikuchii TaxID=84275 RepID=A0A9P3CGH4_9PEZI|nr:uncharacterized protein CKM354_000604700 [Cercospora kikuchii]GIZ42792.1 hypothetical protein CKM354_000604700 [Cercospora kikuchii]